MKGNWDIKLCAWSKVAKRMEFGEVLLIHKKGTVVSIIISTFRLDIERVKSVSF